MILPIQDLAEFNESMTQYIVQDLPKMNQLFMYYIPMPQNNFYAESIVDGEIISIIMCKDGIAVVAFIPTEKSP